MDYSFRKARDGDMEAVIDIFNYYVTNSFAAFPERKVLFLL